MAFVHSKNTKIFVNGRDASAYFRESGRSADIDELETTVFGLGDKTFIPGNKESTISLSGLFEGPHTGDLAGASSDAMVALLLGASGQEILVLPEGDSFGSVGYGASGFATSHEVTSENADVITFDVEARGSGSAGRVEVLHALAAETVTGNGTALDLGAVGTPTLFGASAFLVVTSGSPGAGTLVAKVQHSLDNSAWSDLITFVSAPGNATPALAAQSQYIETAVGVTTTNRYLRAQWTITGTTPSFTFLVAVNRKPS